MRVAVLSDIHANRHALEAVSKDLAEQRVQETWCLGDTVGYGGDPHECLVWVETHARLILKGNHDEAVASGDVRWFNPLAAQAARAHAQLLTPAERALLYGWPEQATRVVDRTRVLAVHASPDDPLHEYVQPADVRLGLRRWEGRARLILMGHTHRPYVAQLEPAGADAAAATWRRTGFAENVVESGEAHAPLLLLNPGSVGQPRDGDARASYAVLDFAQRTVELRRVSYDVEAAAQAIRRQGLDPLLALRLYDGR